MKYENAEKECKNPFFIIFSDINAHSTSILTSISKSSEQLLILSMCEYLSLQIPVPACLG